MAFGITKANNGNDLLSDHFSSEDEHFHDFGIGCSKRINVDYAEEAKDFGGIFHKRKCICVSVIQKDWKGRNLILLLYLANHFPAKMI